MVVADRGATVIRQNHACIRPMKAGQGKCQVRVATGTEEGDTRRGGLTE